MRIRSVLRASQVVTATLAAGAISMIASGAANAATCSSLQALGAAATSFASFTSCTVPGPGPAGQDFFSNVDPIVDDLFGDEGISITESGSFSPGPGTGSEFFGDRLADDFDITPDAVAGADSFTFESLPDGTIFISIKQGNGFELFRVPDAGLGDPFVAFTLTHSLGGGSTSHISTFAGTVPPTVPLPAAGLLLASAMGGLGIAGLRRRKRA